MNRFEQQKNTVTSQLRSLCSRCRAGEPHECRISRLIEEVAELRGVPIIVNDQLHHVMFM